VQIQNEHTFLPYGLPPNYTPPNVAYTPDEDVKNSAPILIESRQPHHAHVSQPIGETYEISHHNLADFEPCLRYATEGQAVGGIPLQNTLEGPQFHPQSHPLHSKTGKNPHAMEEMGKLDHLEERLRAIEGGKDYAFAKVPDFDKYKGTTCPKNHLKMYC